jgi:hypothetical protein
VVDPGSERFPLLQGVDAISLTELATQLATELATELAAELATNG